MHGETRASISSQHNLQLPNSILVDIELRHAGLQTINDPSHLTLHTLLDPSPSRCTAARYSNFVSVDRRQSLCVGSVDSLVCVRLTGPSLHFLDYYAGTTHQRVELTL